MASAEELWQSIRREAEAVARRDHILATSLAKSILDHPGLGSALALQIGQRLGADDERARAVCPRRERSLRGRARTRGGREPAICRASSSTIPR